MTQKYWKKDHSKGYTEISKLGYYNTKEWKKLRLLKLSEQPLCEMCKAENIITPATLVDHIVPITTDNSELFFEYTNLQSLCVECHRLKTIGHKSRYTKIKKGIALKNELNDW